MIMVRMDNQKGCEYTSASARHSRMPRMIRRAIESGRPLVFMTGPWFLAGILCICRLPAEIAGLLNQARHWTAYFEAV